MNGSVAIDEGEEIVGRSDAESSVDDRPGWGRGGLPGTVRVGVDLVDVAEVTESVDRMGDRYLRRIYTEHELECCRTDAGAGPAYSSESLAARFAAKEAVLKVLRPEGSRPGWRSIEVRRDESGWCGIALHATAAEMAADAGIEEIAVSLTHHSMMAAAVVVAQCHPDRKRKDR